MTASTATTITTMATPNPTNVQIRPPSSCRAGCCISPPMAELYSSGTRANFPALACKEEGPAAELPGPNLTPPYPVKSGGGVPGWTRPRLHVSTKKPFTLRLGRVRCHRGDLQVGHLLVPARGIVDKVNAHRARLVGLDRSLGQILRFRCRVAHHAFHRARLGFQHLPVGAVKLGLHLYPGNVGVAVVVKHAFHVECAAHGGGCHLQIRELDLAAGGLRR